MIIESIYVKNFLSHAESFVEFDDARLWLITGENGSGKSALFDAVEYSLYHAHRGATANANLLVKQGQQQALVQVVIRLDGQRLRIRHHIDTKRGNLGGDIARWNTDVADWESINVGTGTTSVRKWLERRLPKHGLFRSGIYLRQSETAYFLSGSASDRMKRFGALIDLSRYTELSVGAARRREEIVQQQRTAQAALDALDIRSDEELEELAGRVIELEGQIEAARREAEEQSARVQGAGNWHRLLTECERLEARRQDFDLLLESEAEICAAAGRVRRWDQDAVKLDRLWTMRENAATRRLEALEADRQAAEATAGRERQQADLDGVQAALKQNEEALTCARQAVTATGTTMNALKLEERIAEARLRLAAAREQAARLADARSALNGWRRCHSMLPYLQSLSEGRAQCDEALEALGIARTTAETAKSAAERAHERAREAHDAAVEKDREADAVLERLSALRSEQDTLKGSVASHRRLTYDEIRCPVCDQLVDADAHRHLQTTLAQELARLDELAVAIKQAASAAEKARDAANRSHGESERLKMTADTADRDHALAERSLTHAESEAKRATDKFRQAGQAAELHAVDYLPVLDTIDADWLTAEKSRVDEGLEKAEARVQQLDAAERTRDDEKASLTTLRHERTGAVPPLGDELGATAIRDELEQAWESAECLRQHVTELDSKERSLQQKGRALAADVARLEEQARNLQAEASRAASQASEDDRFADDLRDALAPCWGNIPLSRAAYDAEQQAINDMRELADRDSHLREAPGQLAAIATRLGSV